MIMQCIVEFESLIHSNCGDRAALFVLEWIQSCDGKG